MATQTIEIGKSSINLEKLETGVYTVYLKGQNNLYAPVKVVALFEILKVKVEVSI